MSGWSDLAKLQLLLGGLYLLDCLRLVPPNAVIVELGRTLCAWRPRSTILLAGRVCVGLAPWTPHRPVLLTQTPPVTPGPDAVALVACQWPLRGEKPPAVVVTVPWADVIGVWADHDRVQIRTAETTHALPALHAAFWADVVRRIWKSSPQDRPAAIKRELADYVAAGPTHEAVRAEQTSARRLALTGGLMLAFLVAWTAATHVEPLWPVAGPLLACAALAWVAAVGQFWHYHRSRRPAAWAERLKHASTLVFYPVSAINVGRRLFPRRAIDPAVIVALSGRSNDDRLIETFARDLTVPLPLAPAAEAEAAWLRPRLAAALSAAWAAEGRTVSGDVVGPAVNRPTCPRCGNEYVVGVDRCHECGVAVWVPASQLD